MSELQQRNEEMTKAATSTLDDLIGLLDGADYMVFLTDATGIVLEARSMRTGDFWGRSSGEWAGTDFSEATNGTNGVGTVLHEGRPMTVAADEHFQVRNVRVICSGAPIYGLQGEIVGCLDISSSAGRNDSLANSLILATAVAASRRIELRILSNAFPKARMVLVSQNEAYAGATLAINRDGGVVGATRSARRLLDLKTEHLTGCFSIDQLMSNEEPDLNWKVAERRLIHSAIVRHQGNSSEAARTLGMSRSTLYRKLRHYNLNE